MERSRHMIEFIGHDETNKNLRIEVAVKQILSGITIKTNASVANPEALEWFQEWASTGTKRRYSQTTK